MTTTRQHKATKLLQAGERRQWALSESGTWVSRSRSNPDARWGQWETTNRPPSEGNGVISLDTAGIRKLPF